MTKQQRADIRWALSDAFVDNEVDYAAIARQTEEFDRDEIKRILFEEVAPVCHSNLESTLPTIWLCFNRAELEDNIEKMLGAKKNSWFKRKANTLLVTWLKSRYKYIWIEIENQYQNISQ
ncbi:hypothetical protein NN484_18055 [Pseudomonas serboccidentalis]|uniref:DUF7079 domain-containing protein n=1 Tax=Pseudomonas serboccidentalis TaxID=2964670 RepID=A0ABY7Z586_9PSED|nr:hypothetical protein [Pseudomonas serboccidentalis]WDR34401.1 hypothetical protein NN484_18055 [Pseudomonas serboccidentalis]